MGFPDMDKVYYGDEELNTHSLQIKEKEAHTRGASCERASVEQLWINQSAVPSPISGIGCTRPSCALRGARCESEPHTEHRLRSDARRPRVRSGTTHHVRQGPCRFGSMSRPL